MTKFGLLITLFACSIATSKEPDTLAPLKNGKAPQNFNEMWAGFDPRTEPLEVEIIKEWEEDGVVLRIVRFRIGIFKGQKAQLAAVYGYPKTAGKKLPGLVQIHGGGQYADHRACLVNAKHGYATVSISWAGRISAPGYRVSPAEVKLFWEGKTDAPNYKLTTDWGALDGYHAPSRNPGNNFPSAKPHPWTMDEVESPRNSPWFLCAIAARRALTFLEQQPEVDPEKLGVYGHSMGGKLTVMTSVDPRVKAAAPSCGGISDRRNDSALFTKTIADQVSLREISCPIVFLSPANDFHGRIGDLPATIQEIQSKDWRVTCSPHRSHQDSAEYEVAAMLWFDQHLKGSFTVPQTPRTELTLKTLDGIPRFTVQPDDSAEILSVDVFYCQQGKMVETRFDRDVTINRFWRHAEAVKSSKGWSAKLPLNTTDKPLWAYANVLYKLEQPVPGAGYYYGMYAANTFNLSSLLDQARPEQLNAAGVTAHAKRSQLIESFDDGWEKEWFHYKRDSWQRMTHKLYDDEWQAPDGAKLELQVRCKDANKLMIQIDEHAAEVELKATSEWQSVSLGTKDFINHAGEGLPNWQNLKQLKLADTARLKPPRGSKDAKDRILGKPWQGSPPVFKNLRWVTDEPK